MSNDPGGQVVIFKKYLTIKFLKDKERRFSYNISETLDSLLTGNTDIETKGLTIMPDLFDIPGEPEVRLFIEDEKIDLDLAVVSREDLIQALLAEIE